MLESVLADVLTRVLGQYLEGIDQESVRFGAWSGLVELRGVALRPEALAVLFETLGMDLPVTVEAGFIGILRLQVPWKSIGSTPVQIHMSDIKIIARPVCGDGSDDSELQMRERRIKRAKLATDDAVREASWGVANETAPKGWGNWLVSEQLRAKIIDNIQIHLSDISLRFEDPFSDPRRPYIISMVCRSLQAVSADENWGAAFVERSSDSAQSLARKLVEVKGFHVDWAPITPRDAPGLSRGTKNPGDQELHFNTPESLKQFMSTNSTSGANGQDETYGVKSLLRPVDGSMRLRLSSGVPSPGHFLDTTEPHPSVDLDIRFPNISIDLDDVQYASLLQTSVYFARLATRGFRPRTPSERWMWAIDQMLPGFSNRREQALRFTEEGIRKGRDMRVLYAGYRKTILKSRRMGIEEPKNISINLEQLEDSLSYHQVISLRDYVDLQIEAEGETWSPSRAEDSEPQDVNAKGTTMSSFWSMLGYGEEKPPPDLPVADNNRIAESSTSAEASDDTSSSIAPESKPRTAPMLLLRVAFLLRGASVRLFQNGFPNHSIPRVSMNLHDLRVGVLYDEAGNLIIESVLGSIDAWDMLDGRRMVYSKQTTISNEEYIALVNSLDSSYPHDVSEAIEAIRNGTNPAKDLIADGEDYSDDEDGQLPGDHYFGSFEEQNDPRTSDDGNVQRYGTRNRSRGHSGSREPTPPNFRVSETEFLGTSRQSERTPKYVAAFRYSQTIAGSNDASNVSGSKLDVSVATLEAIIDGPKGSFVWGLKFWQPKGMAQDPIMAFLGAAAGQRIAELRMELETALLANRVPMEISAVISAPRFIFPSSTADKPAIVVNMGILGICTSDNAPEHRGKSEKRESNIRYSNYVLTLDDLGMYFAPNLLTAVSQEIRQGTGDSSETESNIVFRDTHYVDTANVERIIRPFSLRFLLQTLRDASVVQVAQSPCNPSGEAGNKVAKVRIRGNVPGLYLIVTQDSVHHFIVEGQRWGFEMKASNNQQTSATRHPSGVIGWQPLAGENDDTQAVLEAIGVGIYAKEEYRKEGAMLSSESIPPTTMASYDIRTLVQRVSVEVRNSSDVRLITAVASGLQTSIVKTGRTKLQADFSLRSWAVTDSSRGRTAAFRRLAFAGVLEGSKAVSPPRSTMSANQENQKVAGRKDFITIQYSLDLVASEHTVHFRFLSLNMVCVRETYVKLASFFYKVCKRAKQSIRENRPPSSLSEDCEPSVETTLDSLNEADGSQTDMSDALSNSKLTVTSEFDGFSFQLVASGGAIALIEMKESRIHFTSHNKIYLKAYGGFRSFSVRDWTAPIADHTNVITYERTLESNLRSATNRDSDDPSDGLGEDQWTLLIPKSRTGQYRLRTYFRGIKICFLYRFSVVLEKYFSVLRDGVKPALDVVMEQVGDLGLGHEEGTQQPPILTVSNNIVADVKLHDLVLCMPRHSGCASEAMLINFSTVQLTNSGSTTKDGEWQADFQGLNFAVNYLLSTTEKPPGGLECSSPFLQDCSARVVLRKKPRENKAPQPYDGNLALFLDIQVHDHVKVTLSEAQYTVLYFVLTENLVETIHGSEMAADIGREHCSLSHQQSNNHDLIGSSSSIENDGGMNPETLTLPAPESLPQNAVVLDINMEIPALTVEVSRGWEVDHIPCKVIGMYTGHVNVDLTYREPSHMLFQFAADLLSVIDLRQERKNVLPFAVPLVPGDLRSEQRENIAITYEKQSGKRPSIVMFFRSLHTQVVPELLRDLSFLAIPGWPYLRTSSFAPEIAYLGRNLTVLLGSSQILLCAEEHEKDERGIVLTGDFQLKVDWMRDSGAKRISLQSTQLEMSVVTEFPEVEKMQLSECLPHYRAQRFNRAQTPLLYPADSLIEYVGPAVDESGHHLDISLDSLLCLVNAADIPLLRAVLNRSTRMKPSYLISRDWKQTSLASAHDDTESKEPSPKEESSRKAKENLAVTVQLPAARFLITDENDNRFIPIMESRLKYFSINAHMGNMFQVEGEIAMDLFNLKKGWWEPALESWFLAASMSNGKSGTRAIVLKSEKRLNLNITPTTVTAAMAVARSLNSATKKRKNPSLHSKKIQKEEDQQDPLGSEEVLSSRRPSVAAFLIRNELGLPIAMSLASTSRRTTIAHNSEVEVGAQTEDLLHASMGGSHRSRSDTLRCYVFVPRYNTQEVSASEVGKQYITLLPHSKGNTEGLDVEPVKILWVVEMVNGVPVGTIRSLYRIVNDTAKTLALRVAEKGNEEFDTRQCTLQTGQYYSIPIFECDKTIQVRPMSSPKSEDYTLLRNPDASQGLFTWSSALPTVRWLSAMAGSPDSHRWDVGSQSNGTTICCRSTQTGMTDFYLGVAVHSPDSASAANSDHMPWVDLSLRAPIILENKLPGFLSYRITQRCSSSVSKPTAPEDDGPVLAAGIISPLKDSHLHFTGEKLSSTFLSFAYENSTNTSDADGPIAHGRGLAAEAPFRFGPEVNFQRVGTKKLAIVLPSAERSVDSKGQLRRDFRAAIRCSGKSRGRYEIFAGFWIRNRSDTAVRVCSRDSYYGSGSQQFHLRSRPPVQEPDAFVCLEGPYLSIRLGPEELDSSIPAPQLAEFYQWWTTPSLLEEITKPLTVAIGGRSLELDVRPAVGLENCTSVITIRNSAWICNNTTSVLQWCQSSAVDSHGNCPTRFLNNLQPTEFQAIHWKKKSAQEAVRLRLANDAGQSDWIWSPSIPLHIGFSRELPAKMYRPKTQEQYIARVASKRITGASIALIVYAEDRHNPPYRIVNLCKDRAVAFSQLRTQERPWLVRAGKTSRYSWDNPLASSKDRFLSIRILEKEELNTSMAERHPEGTSSAGSSHRHEERILNIDVVGERVMVLSESYAPTLVVNVSVEGATKFVTFCEEDSNGQLLMPARKPSEATKTDEASTDPVLIVGWDDIGRKAGEAGQDQIDASRQRNVTNAYDYPTLETSHEGAMQSKKGWVDTDAALFLDSIGISVITRKPVELLYICFKGVSVNYEAYSKLECLSLQIQSCQIDNQLPRTPYPVLMWVHHATSSMTASMNSRDNSRRGASALSFEVQRKVTNDDILMINSFQGSLRPFDICFEDELVSELLSFLADTSIMGATTRFEPLTGSDNEKIYFERNLYESRKTVENEMSSINLTSRQTSISSSKRIYVQDFKILNTSLCLTSSGSGAAVAKAAGINASARALVALLLNVENCEFLFPTLHVQNVFDSLHHFAVLVRKSYETQLSNQRMNLLASNALVGNPAALFDAVGTGARELFNEPGRAKGSAEFIAKVGRGSKSLLTHTVGGLVDSVSGIPRAMSSGLEKAVGDSEYLAERGRIRGSQLSGGQGGSSVKNPAQGLATGAVSFAHGISSGVTGLIREPMQGAKRGGTGGFLKGIGKAFIGGVAKPMAGAIDLVAEPAVGFSRQIKSTQGTSGNPGKHALPERPPRAFRGQNRSLEPYDRRYAIGYCLYNAAQLISGLSFTSTLLDWVELSNRSDRKSANGEFWVWNILRQYARSMPGTKRQIRSGQSSSSASQSLGLDTRPEKTRIALITKTEIAVVTIDCKIITTIPLWDDCTYTLVAKGKEIVVRIALKTSENYDLISGASGFSVGSLISAPWDAPAVGKRRKPNAREELVDRVDCGSAEARGDLYTYMRHLTLASNERSIQRLKRQKSQVGRESSSFGVELSSISQSQHVEGQELKRAGDPRNTRRGSCGSLNELETNYDSYNMRETEQYPDDSFMTRTSSNVYASIEEGTREDGPLKHVVADSRTIPQESTPENMSQDEMSLQQLVEIGFSFEDSVKALAEAGGDLVKAVDILTR